MQPTYLHDTFASFCWWAENYLLTQGQAYRNYTSKLYYQNDPTLGSSLVAYAAPFKQWVYDFGVSGASIPSGISGSLNLVRGQSGLRFDYNNGRVILNSAVGKSLNISGSYAFKDFNFYLSDETEESLLFDTKFFLNSRTKPAPSSGITPYDYVAPCIFATVLENENDPYALGGLKKTTTSFSLIVYAETSWQLNGALSIFTDAEHKYFPYLPVTGAMFTEYGDIKTGLYPSGYNYNSVKNAAAPGQLIYIESVRASRIYDRNNDVNPDVFAGLIQIDVSRERIT